MVCAGDSRGIASTRLARSGYEWCTQSVLYSLAGATAIVDRSASLLSAVVAWDDMLSCLQLGTKHPLDWGRTLWKGHYMQMVEDRPLLAFTFRKPLTAQLEALGAIGSVTASDVTG